MAHDCPDCGAKCHCRGDIDDLVLNEARYVNACEHCPIELYDDGADDCGEEDDWSEEDEY